MTSRHRKTLRILAGVLVLLGLIAGPRVWYLEEQGNFHAITPGEAYRSAQLDRDELEHYVRQYKIRSIINLRGERTGKPWYKEEIATAARLGVRHFDFGGIGASRPPSNTSMSQLLELMATAPRPVLIHCWAGADRSGLVAAIWKVAVDGASPAEAAKQLSVRYGHMPVGSTQILDEYFGIWSASNSANNNARR